MKRPYSAPAIVCSYAIRQRLQIRQLGLEDVRRGMFTASVQLFKQGIESAPEILLPHILGALRLGSRPR